MNNSIKINDLIDKIVSAGASHADIAVALGVTVKSVENWASGKHYAKGEKLRKLKEFANDPILLVNRRGFLEEQSINNEALLRTLLSQVAEIKAILQSRKIEDVMVEVNKDSAEALHSIKSRIGKR
jgi:transcriptional regulator with XRE-family HTH domain